MQLSEFGMNLFLDKLIEKLQAHVENCGDSVGRNGAYLDSAVRDIINEIRKVMDK